MPGFLLVNPRSGSARPPVEELLAAATSLGVRTHVLADGDDSAELARDAEATALGVAGGDGSLAPVAAVAIDRDLPFVCIPFGTRNHFARDAGIDPDDPIAALSAFGGSERRIDVGRVGTRLFLNNVALGAYAHLVHEREHHRRRRQALARLRALAIAVRRPRPVSVWANGTRFRAAVILFANNEYCLELLSLGTRERLDQGVLVLYVTERLFPLRWLAKRGARYELSAGRPLQAAVDGEPVELESPLEVEIEPLRLRLLQPAG